MTARTALILAVLQHPAPVRSLTGRELGGPVVQLLARGTTDPTWTATPILLAEQIDAALTAAEKKDIPTDGTAASGLGTAFTPRPGHALTLRPHGPDLVGICGCGQAIGRAPRSRSTDGLIGLWERHTSAADSGTAWAAALASLPTTSIGSS